MGALLAAIAGVGLAVDAYGKVQAGRQAKMIGQWNARSITDIGDQNAQLAEETANLSADAFDFNASALRLEAQDAVERGRTDETNYRTQVRGLIGSQRANFAAQGIDIADGSPIDVYSSTAREGERNALQIRTDANRQAWGFNVEAQGQSQQAARARKLGKLQGKNIRDVARTNSLNALIGGNAAASQSYYSAASTLIGGAANLALNYYGFSKRTS